MAEINEATSEPKVKKSKKTEGKKSSKTKVSKSLLQKANQGDDPEPTRQSVVEDVEMVVLEGPRTPIDGNERSEEVPSESENAEIVDNTEATDPEIAEPEIVATEATDPDQMANPEIVDVTETNKINKI
ncbi:titin-like [Drosophila rhopaloa]|uniref:Titin-like n=1 Tax=Drosophila rhopaloa TaxID=1041015 RepID=A0A6P4F6A5_DRORH|nr:titin-like [Drosophila rhopaloa]